MCPLCARAFVVSPEVLQAEGGGEAMHLETPECFAARRAAPPYSRAQVRPRARPASLAWLRVVRNSFS
eukprot:8048142-Alexandrium_andersonii.AAC.1